MKVKQKAAALLTTASLSMNLAVAAMATGTPTGDVSAVIEQTWQSAAQQIKTVVNNGAATRCC